MPDIAAANGPFAAWSDRSTSGVAGAPNQDGFWMAPERQWVIMLDGGGPDGCGIAACQAVQAFLAAALTAAPTKTSAEVDALLAAANDHLLRVVPVAGARVAVLIAHWAPTSLRLWWLGNVRAYLWREGTVQPLTTDHTLATLLVERGQLADTDVWQHPADRKLLRFLGKPQHELPGHAESDLRAGDRILFATDGVHRTMPGDHLQTCLGAPTPQAVLEQLWEPAGEDDRTAFVADAVGAESGRSLIDGLWQAISKARHPAELLVGLLELAVRTCRGERGFIFAVDSAGNLDCQAQAGHSLMDSSAVSRSVLQQVVQSGQSVCVTDTKGDRAYSDRQSILALDLRAILCVPLMVRDDQRDRVGGLLYIDHTRPLEAQQDLRHLEVLTSYAGVILQNSLLYASACRQNERLRILNALGRQISGTADTDGIVQAVLTHALEVSDADEAHLLLGPALAHRAGLTRTGKPAPLPRLSQSAIRHVVAEHTSLCILDGINEEMPVTTASLLSLDLHTVMCVPMMAAGQLKGLLYVSGRAALTGFTPADLEFLELLASQAAVALANASLLQQQQQHIEQLEQMISLYQVVQTQATTDPLTGLYNRTYLDDHGPAICAAARRSGHPLALMMLDLDHFKAINDTRGHAAGDEVLCRVGNTLLTLCRGSDTVARFGGEEFVILLPRTEPEVALALAERMREAVGQSHVIDEGCPVTVSIGIAHLTGDDTCEGLMAIADAALYQAKAAGRDQVKVLRRNPA